MKHKFIPPRITSLADCLELNELDSKFIEEIRYLHNKKNGNVSVIESVIFEKITCKDFAQIIRLSEADRIIKHYSSREELNFFWGQILAVYIPDKKKILKPQPHLSNFNLVCGYYYYNKGLDIRKIAEGSFTTLELEFFNHAANEYSSIHSVIELNKSDYLKIEKGINSDAHAQSCINRCLRMVVVHKSPAYLLLIESYIRYIEHLVTSQDERRGLIEGCMTSALKACEKMTNLFLESEIEIENASFGEGLKSLNSLHMEYPKEITEYLEDYSSRLSNSISFRL